MRPLEKFFIVFAPLLRPTWIQLMLRACYVPLPYRFAKHLQYRGNVPFMVNGKSLRMRSHNTPIEITIFWRGLFKGREGIELKVWSELVTPESLVLDIGANNGVYSLVASALTKQVVWAFEPVPAVYAMLEENVVLSELKNVSLQSEVVSDVDGTQTLHVPTVERGWTDIASLDKAFVTQRAEAVHQIECPTITVDTFLQTKSISHTQTIVCKVDVEGAEERVVRGMRQTLATHNLVLLIEMLESTTFSTCQGLLPAGYKIFPVTKQGVSGTAVTERVAGVKNYLVKRV